MTTLKNRIQDEFDRLGLTQSPVQLCVAAENGTLTADLVTLDQLACAFERFAFAAPRLDNAALEHLDRLAEQLAKKLSYLLESISPIERDRDGCVIQMRSSPPHQDDDGTSYYELLVRRGELSLFRYAKAVGQTRRIVPAHVTREVFCRLAADFAAVAQS